LTRSPLLDTFLRTAGSSFRWISSLLLFPVDKIRERALLLLFPKDFSFKDPLEEFGDPPEIVVPFSSLG